MFLEAGYHGYGRYAGALANSKCTQIIRGKLIWKVILKNKEERAKPKTTLSFNIMITSILKNYLRPTSLNSANYMKALIKELRHDNPKTFVKD